MSRVDNGALNEAMKLILNYVDNEFRNDILNSIQDKTVQSYANYSFDEQCIGVWVNGKPLYQKTINMGMMNKGAFSIDHNIDNLEDVACIIPLIFNGAFNRFSTCELGAELQISATQVLFTNNNFTHMNNRGWVTIQYTKTTDIVNIDGVGPTNAISDWNYTIDGENVILNYYIGSGTDVTVYAKYYINYEVYNTIIPDESAVGNNGSNPYMFNASKQENCKNIRSITFQNGINVSSLYDIYDMFMNCQSLETIVGFNDLFANRPIRNFGYLFYGCTSLTSLDLSKIYTRGAQNVVSMFEGCTNLTEIKVSRSKWMILDSCNSTNMFKGCGVSEVTYVD